MTFSHIVWAEQVAEGADLPDQRLQSRFTAILVDTIERPSAANACASRLTPMAWNGSISVFIEAS